MGMQSTKSDFIWHILSLASKDGRVLGYKVVGPLVWVLMEYDNLKMIECYQLYFDYEGWDFKVTDEYQGFKFYSCPLLWLGQANEFDPNWRVRVREYHR